MSCLDALRWNADGLVPAIAQDAAGGRVLMLAWMSREALSATVATGYAHYWSRSRQRLWKKGESSGHVQRVREVRTDCDADTVLLIVDQAGGIACHTGHERCFYLRLDEDEWRDVEPIAAPSPVARGSGPAAIVAPPSARRATDDIAGTLARVAATIEARRGADPASSYVASLFAGNGDAVLKKIGEEATETVLAAKAGDAAAVTHEVADLWFHCLVLLARHGLSPDDVLGELARRHGTSGIAEKAARKRDP